MTETINALAIYAGLDTYPTSGTDASINHAITIIFNKIENALSNLQPRSNKITPLHHNGGETIVP